MALKSEAVNVGDVVKWEVNPSYCREKLLLKGTPTVKIGSLLRWDATATAGYILVADGSETLVTAIALEASAATGGSIVGLTRGPAIVDKDRLSLEANVTWAEVSAYLLARGILGLSEPVKYTEGTA